MGPFKNSKAFPIAPIELIASEEQVPHRGPAFTFSLWALVLLCGMAYICCNARAAF